LCLKRDVFIERKTALEQHGCGDVWGFHSSDVGDSGILDVTMSSTVLIPDVSEEHPAFIFKGQG
jgi:hypothetical protein